MTIRRSARIGMFALLAGLAPLVTVDSAHAAVVSKPWSASFEGSTIDLRNGWGDAKACTSDGTTTRCYRTETEMDKATTTLTASAPLAALSSCSSTVKLYSSTSYGGSVLQLSTQFTFINLSLYGFNNTTSSYKIGACDATFYDGSNGGAPSYGGNTAANIWSPSMLAGWDNRISSIYIS